ncbi:MAG: hypothetical protein MJ106_07035 [Lentisphaeria bacterium]|nr:hypothetical protein [Lentisphaeria bacterium]
MAESRQMAEWDRTAAILLMLYNANRDPKKSKELTQADFNPLRSSRENSAVSVNSSEAREIFQAIVEAARR